MTRLTEKEAEALRSLKPDSLQQPELDLAQRWVLPTPAARRDYIRFATDASRFFRGRREVGFRGDNWLL